jgi:hypothetical protein
MQTAQDGAGNGAAPPAASGSPQATGTDALPSPRLGIGNGRTNGTPAPGDVDDYSGDADSPSPWGENWREALGRGDAARMKRLERYATPDAIADALLATQDRLRRGAQMPLLPDDATEDEIKEFRKANGVPDKASDYGLAFPDGTTPSEAEKLRLSGFQEFMHSKHIPPAHVKAAFEYYTAVQEHAQQERVEQVTEMNAQAVAELRKEYPGREFKRNMTIAEEFLSRHFEGDEAALDQVLQAYLPNGMQVKNFPPFIKGLVRMGRAGADEEALIGGDGSGGGKTIDEEYRELTAIVKPTQQQQDRMLALSEARQARAIKQGRG